MSLLIKSLEEMITTQLVARDARPLKLTEAGERFLPLAERILQDVELAEHVGRAAMHERITVAALPTLSAALLPGTIAQFRSNHPNVVIQIRDVLTEEIVARVRSGDAQIGLGAFPGHADDLTILPLFRDRLVAVAAPALFDRSTICIDWPMLASHPLILMGRDSNVRKLVEVALLRHRVNPRPAFEVQMISTAVSLVQAGLGVAIIPRLEAELVPKDAVRILELKGSALWREIGVIMRRGAFVTPVLDQFIEAVRRRGASAGKQSKRARTA